MDERNRADPAANLKENESENDDILENLKEPQSVSLISPYISQLSQ